MLIQQPKGQRLQKHEYKDITNKETKIKRPRASEDLKASRRKNNFRDKIWFSRSCEYKYRVHLKCDAVPPADSV